MRQDKSPDRHLQKRADGGFRYVRRIPERVLALLRVSEPDVAPFVRRSLATSSRDEARVKRDAMEAADDDYWARRQADQGPSLDLYQKALARARSLRLTYLPVEVLASEATPVEELLERIALAAATPDRPTAAAALGGAGTPETSLDDAFATFETVIRKRALAKKSPWQLLKWRQLKQRGIANFKAAVGDIAVEKITREDARAFYEHWLGRIAPDDDEAPRLSASAGNKDMDTLRALVGEYLAYAGRETANPFRGLRFTDDSTATRPAFSESWIRTKLLAGDALASLNTAARLAVLGLINTGARPSEVANLTADAIVLDADIPHIDIRPAAKRELKNRATARRIPLAGVSLDAFRQARDGFAAYRDNDNLSATVNKFLRENELMETPGHTLYSLRHGFEARLKLAEVDEELRRYLMGHAIRRPRYGYSDDLTWAAGAIAKVAL